MPERGRKRNRDQRRLVGLLTSIGLLSAIFAKVEIQIEGASGWAANLPTWRLEHHWILDLVWGGRPLTGYHVWMFLFIALVFHLTFFLYGRFTSRLELRVLGSLALFWILEDFLWFVMNPAFGLSKFNHPCIPWHPHWLIGVPADYVVYLILGSLMIWLSFRRKIPRQLQAGARIKDTEKP